MGTSLGAAKMNFSGEFVRVSLVVLFCLPMVNVLEESNLSCPKVDLQQVSVRSSGNGGSQCYLWQLGHWNLGIAAWWFPEMSPNMLSGGHSVVWNHCTGTSGYSTDTACMWSLCFPLAWATLSTSSCTAVPCLMIFIWLNFLRDIYPDPMAGKLYPLAKPKAVKRWNKTVMKAPLKLERKVPGNSSLA